MLSTGEIKMISGLKTSLFLLGSITLCLAMFSQANPMLCSTVYKSNGPISMLHAPECSYLHSIDFRRAKTFCRARLVDGQNLYLCSLHLTTPLPATGDKGTEKVKIIGSAVFSRNNNNGYGFEAEAIRKAYHLGILMNYFSLHTQLLVQERQFSGKIDDSFPFRLFLEALIRTAKDANQIFSSEACLREFASDSTATITLSIHGQHILVANIGHPRTCVWSMKLRPWGEHESSSHREFFRELRKGKFSTGRIKDIDFVESSEAGRFVTRPMESTDYDPERRTWIEYAYDLVVDSIHGVPMPTDQPHLCGSHEDSLDPSQESPSTPDIDLEVNQAMASYPLARFQVVEKMNLRDALWEERSDVNAAELLVGAVISRDDMGHLAVVVVPLHN